MQNLIRLFQRYHVTFLFLILQIIGFLLIVSGGNRFHQASVANSSNAFVGRIYELNNTIINYFSLRSYNDLLNEENARLLERIVYLENLQPNVDSISNKIDSIQDVLYHFSSATIINSTINLRKNYLTINSGKLDGINTDMAVIGHQGIIGYTVAVSDHYSVVIPVINESFKLPVTHTASGSFGLVSWMPSDSYKTATIIDIPISIEVNVGDTIVTRGSDGMFPKGILVGVIEKVDNETGQSFQLLTIRLSENFDKVNKVKVVEFIQQKELREIEQVYYP
jgi:rod shape-determining protein MreC